ncbi:MAG: hypothetical protein ACM3JB_00640 [Acidobacteriaceae bacterium]
MALLAVFGGIVGVGIFIFVWIYVRRQSRLAWTSFADQNGFSPVRKPVFTAAECSDIPLFGRGFCRKFVHPFERSLDGTLVRAFNFEYSFGLPWVASIAYTQTVIAFRSYAASLPSFQLQAATALDRIGGKLSGKHLHPYVETNFSKRYLLRGHDPISILAVFRPEVVQAIESQTPGTEWSMESGGGWLIFYRWKYVVPMNVLINAIYENAWFANLITNGQLPLQQIQELSIE